MKNVLVRVEGGYAVVEARREDRPAVAGVLLDLVDRRSEVTTVTHVRGGLAFRVPARYSDRVHDALVADSAASSDVDVEVEVASAEEPRKAPARNAGRDDWVAFLDAEGVDYPDDAGRNDLIEIWDSRGTDDAISDE